MYFWYIDFFFVFFHLFSGIVLSVFNCLHDRNKTVQEQQQITFTLGKVVASRNSNTLQVFFNYQLKIALQLMSDKNIVIKNVKLFLKSVTLMTKDSSKKRHLCLYIKYR